jgi:hypothetical protein
MNTMIVRSGVDKQYSAKTIERVDHTITWDLVKEWTVIIVHDFYHNVCFVV